MATAQQDQGQEELKLADKKWGFKFGVDGLMPFAEACRHLGMSRDTLERRVAKDLLRKGRHPDGGYAICVRSIELYKAKMEV